MRSIRPLEDWIALTIVTLGTLLICELAHAEPDYEALANAIKITEGVPYYGIKSVHWDSYAEARQICINTCRNNYKRWVKAGKPGEYLDFLADRYCPPSVDPIGNKNWKRNMKRLYRHKTD